MASVPEISFEGKYKIHRDKIVNKTFRLIIPVPPSISVYHLVARQRSLNINEFSFVKLKFAFV